MSRLGHIDPELHGLLDEIVADPRSALRLTPRKALSSWLFSDEQVRRPASATNAERHLLEAHREALAELLIQASRIAFWKAPGLAFKVASSPDSRIPEATEKELERLVEIEARHNPEVHSAVGKLLRDWPLRAEQALDFARASLAIVPSDEARYAVAIALRETEPEAAIKILEALDERLGKKRNAEIVWRIRSSLGSRQALAKQFDAARSSYTRCLDMAPASVVDDYSVANLSFYLGDSLNAREAARRIALDPGAAQYAHEQRRVFGLFAAMQAPRTLDLAKRTFKKLPDPPPALLTACEVFL